MKIALAQLNYHVGNFEANTSKIIRAVKEAEAAGAELVVFSELCVCGYPARDFLNYPHFITQCENAVNAIAAASGSTAVLIGAPVRNPVLDGKDLFNAALLLQHGKVQKVFHKTLLPTYDVFDEYRYFEPNNTFEILELNGKKIAVTICEDIWNVGNENPLYKLSPMDMLMQHQPEIIVNLSASPFSHIQHRERLKVLQANVERYKIPLVYVNQVGAQTELIFDGGSMVMNEAGKVLCRLPFFEEKTEIIDMTCETQNVIHAMQENLSTPISHLASIYNALVLGIRDYFSKLGFKKAILGLSGGIDSALVLCLAVDALGKENVMSILLPSEFSSQHSIDDSLALLKNLHSPYEIVSIKNAYNAFEETMQPYFLDLPFNVAEENIQSRSRAVILMAFGNKFGYILLNTTNKSEAAVGYGTLYGDMCGGISVLGDVYKTQVYELANYINRNGEIIPQNIITKAPSAELRPNQKDSDSLPEYDVLDKILHAYIEQHKGVDEIVQEGFDEALVKRVLKMVNMNEWKRFQAPPVLRISPKSFGIGRRMPIEGKYLG
jgi:NAD+ synthase (glutamine-hydrolysing)